MEIDLRLLQDGSVLMMHDDSPSRTTNVGQANLDFNIETMGRIYNESGVLTRPMDPVVHSKLNSSFTQSDIINQFSWRKKYDKFGHYIGRVSPSQPYYMDILFEYFLGGTYAPIWNSSVFVLDIQNYGVFKRVYPIVKNLNVFDRVVFKLWAEAIPMSVVNNVHKVDFTDLEPSGIIKGSVRPCIQRHQFAHYDIWPSANSL